MAWIKHPLTVAQADLPLHAGVCKDLLRGNLRHVTEQNCFDIIALGPDIDNASGSHANEYHIVMATANQWERIYRIGYSAGFPYQLGWLPGVLVRPEANGTNPRSVKVTMRGRVSGTGTVTVRVYLRASQDVTSYAIPYPGETCYAEMSFNSTDLKQKDATITTPGSGSPMSITAHPDDTMGGEPPPGMRSQLEVIAQCNTASRSFYFETLRLTEVGP